MEYPIHKVDTALDSTQSVVPINSNQPIRKKSGKLQPTLLFRRLIIFEMHVRSCNNFNFCLIVNTFPRCLTVEFSFCCMLLLPLFRFNLILSYIFNRPEIYSATSVILSLCLFIYIYIKFYTFWSKIKDIIYPATTMDKTTYWTKSKNYNQIISFRIVR